LTVLNFRILSDTHETREEGRMIGPTEIIIIAVICLVPLGIIFGTLGIVKLARRSDSAPQGNSDLAIASLVLGIISLLAWLLPILGVPIAVVGLVFGVMSRNSPRRRMAIAGMVMSAIGLLAVVVNLGVSLFLQYD
jgi:Na+/proline symporter